MYPERLLAGQSEERKSSWTHWTSRPAIDEDREHRLRWWDNTV